jgi:hypothetical protein
MENSMKNPQKTLKPSNTTSEHIFNCNGDTCTPIFIAALFTIAKLWKQPRCPATYILFIRKEEGIRLFAGKWMKLENIMLSKVSQVEKDKG